MDEDYEVQAREAIAAAYGTPEDEYGTTLFVSHHLEEIGDDYWLQTFGDANPSPTAVLNGLVVAEYRVNGSRHSIDFTLPGQVADSVICVIVDEHGTIESISMES